RVLVAIGVGPGRSEPEPGGGADGGLVDQIPEGPWPLERLVVESGCKNWRQSIVDSTEIEAQRRPVVLRAQHETADCLDARRAVVGIDATAAPVDRQQGVRLLGTVAKDAARTVILERPTDKCDAVGEQRRG